MKEKTYLKMDWSGLFQRLNFLINRMLVSSNFLLTTPSTLNLVLDHMNSHVILIYCLICEWDCLMNGNLSQGLLFIVYNMNG